MDQLRLEGIVDFGPQPPNHHVHDVGVGGEVDVPNVPRDLRARHDLAGGTNEMREQEKFLRGQVERGAGASGLARLSIDQGLGPETVYEPHPATISLSGTTVRFPVGGFLQATEDGEAALSQAVHEAVGDARRAADLFAGLGTFALAEKATYAAEASRDAAAALKAAAPSLSVEHRDLYRRPLDQEELSGFDAVILDPPRAGAFPLMPAPPSHAPLRTRARRVTSGPAREPIPLSASVTPHEVPGDE